MLAAAAVADGGAHGACNGIRFAIQFGGGVPMTALAGAEPALVTEDVDSPARLSRLGQPGLLRARPINRSK